MNRSELSELSDKSFDVIVVGAGINGAGVRHSSWFPMGTEF